MYKKIAHGGIAAALSVILLALSVYLPTGKAAALFLASTLSYVMCFIADKKTAVVMYLASSVLGFIISPAGALTIITTYIICFGNYPIFKTTLDTKPLAISVLFKLLLYILYCVAVYLVFTFIAKITLPYAPWVLLAAGVPVFAFYDFLLSYTGKYLAYQLSKRF